MIERYYSAFRKPVPPNGHTNCDDCCGNGNIDREKTFVHWIKDAFSTLQDALHSENPAKNLNKIFKSLLDYIKENKEKPDLREKIYNSIAKLFNTLKIQEKNQIIYNQISPIGLTEYSTKTLWEKLSQLTGQEWWTCKYRTVFFKDLFDQMNEAWNFWLNNIIMYQKQPWQHSWMRIESEWWDVLYFVDRYYQTDVISEIKYPEEYEEILNDRFSTEYIVDNPNVKGEFDDLKKYLQSARTEALKHYDDNIKYKEKIEGILIDNDKHTPHYFRVKAPKIQLEFSNVPLNTPQTYPSINIVIDDEILQNSSAFWENIYEKYQDQLEKKVMKEEFVTRMNQNVSKDKLQTYFYQWVKDKSSTNDQAKK